SWTCVSRPMTISHCMPVVPVSLGCRASGPRAAAGRRLEHHRPGLVVDARRAVLLAPGVPHRDPPGILPDHHLAAAAVALDELDVRAALGLAKRAEIEAAAAALADCHLPGHRLHL